MKKIEGNKIKFTQEAEEYFADHYQNQDEVSFLIGVATNWMLYDADVEYVEGNFEQSLLNLIKANPFSQLTEVFADTFGLDKTAIIVENSNNDEIKVLETVSDAGSVRVGNEAFDFLIPNGYGDGVTKVIIMNVDKTNIPMRFFTKIDGYFNIYTCDTYESEDVCFKLNGQYMVYSEDGTVIFGYSS